MMMVVPIWILYRYKMGKRNASQQIDWWHTISYYYINFNNLVHKCLKFVLITLILRLMIPRHGDNDTSSSKPTAAPLCRLVNRCQPEEEACLEGSFMYKRWRWRLYFSFISWLSCPLPYQPHTQRDGADTDEDFIFRKRYSLKIH